MVQMANEPIRTEGQPPYPVGRRLLKAQEVAETLGLSRTKVWAMLQSGELPSIRIGKSVRVPAAALDQWIEERTETGGYHTAYRYR